MKMDGLLSIMILAVGMAVIFAVGPSWRYLGYGLRYMLRTDDDGDGLSAFGALCTTLAATLGTGNIVGVGLAIVTGGAGALFWMLAASVPCMVLKYAECALAVRFGGPFQYIETAIGRPMAKLYALCGAAAGALGIGTLTQVDGIVAVAAQFSPQLAPLSAVAVAFLAAVVLCGGGKRIEGVCRTVVPVMAVAYVVCCLCVLVRFAPLLPRAVLSVFRQAFSLRAGWGGLLGCMVIGISRGVFSNEAGLGSGGITAAAVTGADAASQGLVGQAGVCIDTTVMCTLSGLCVVVSGAAEQNIPGALVTSAAFSRALGVWAGGAVELFLCFFAFTTVIGWYFCAERCFVYLSDGRWQRMYRWFYVLMILLTPFVNSRRIWMLAGVLNCAMVVPNLAAVFCLRRQIPLFKLHK